jgi:hypothetical protein
MPAIVPLTVDLHVLGTAFSLPAGAKRTTSGFTFRRGSVTLAIVPASSAAAAVPPRLGGVRGRRILIPGARTAKRYVVGQSTTVCAYAHHRAYRFAVSTTPRPDPSLTDRIVDTFRVR